MGEKDKIKLEAHMQQSYWHEYNKLKAKLTESEADNENLKRHGLRLQDCIDNRDKEIARLREALGKWECDITNAISDIRNDNMLDTEATLMEVLTEIEALKKGGE